MFTIDVSANRTINDNFRSAADDLLNNYILVVRDKYYRLLEVEFYYHSEKDNHPDAYAHKHKQQLRSGSWYFHGSGLDVTFGDRQNDAYGGILIRSIQLLNPDDSDDASDITVIGPLKVVTAIMSNFGSATDAAPFSFYLHNLSEAPLPMLERLEKQEICEAPRIGLNAEKDSSEDKKYHTALYRYLILPHLPHKQKQQIAEVMFQKLRSAPDALEQVRKKMGSDFLKHLR